VRREGIPDYRRRNVGHGIGLELYEAPLLVPDDEDDDTAGCANHATTLEPGMVINVELPYFELGVGGLQIEETVVVTQEGCKLLTTASRDMHVCGLRA
jgi:Xaa-Pro aminopeptidase